MHKYHQDIVLLHYFRGCDGAAGFSQTVAARERTLVCGRTALKVWLWEETHLRLGRSKGRASTTRKCTALHSYSLSGACEPKPVSFRHNGSCSYHLEEGYLASSAEVSLSVVVASLGS